METWSSSLFDCYADCFSCCVTGYVGPCLQGESVHIALGDRCWPHGFLAARLGCIGGAYNREKIRKKYNIDGSWCNDCCVMCCCAPCATCQMYREAKIHSYITPGSYTVTTVDQPEYPKP